MILYKTVTVWKVGAVVEPRAMYALWCKLRYYARMIKAGCTICKCRECGYVFKNKHGLKLCKHAGVTV